MQNETTSYKLKIYGTNNYVAADANSLCSVATLASQADIQSKELYCWRYNFGFENEGERADTVGNYAVGKSLLRGKFDIEIGRWDKQTEFADYLGLKSVLVKDNHFLEMESIPYSVAVHSAGQAIAIVITDYEEEDESGYKAITFKAVKRYLE